MYHWISLFSVQIHCKHLNPALFLQRLCHVNSEYFYALKYTSWQSLFWIFKWLLTPKVWSRNFRKSDPIWKFGWDLSKPKTSPNSVTKPIIIESPQVLTDTSNTDTDLGQDSSKTQPTTIVMPVHFVRLHTIDKFFKMDALIGCPSLF